LSLGCGKVVDGIDMAKVVDARQLNIKIMRDIMSEIKCLDLGSGVLVLVRARDNLMKRKYYKVWKRGGGSDAFHIFRKQRVLLIWGKYKENPHKGRVIYS
jgi:hypothetical protein